MLSLYPYTEVAGGLLPPVRGDYAVRLKLTWENVVGTAGWHVTRVVDLDTCATPRDVLEQQARCMNRRYGIFIDPCDYVLQAAEPPGVILDSQVCPKQKLLDYPWVCGKLMNDEEISVRVLKIADGPREEPGAGNVSWVKYQEQQQNLRRGGVLGQANFPPTPKTESDDPSPPTGVGFLEELARDRGAPLDEISRSLLEDQAQEIIDSFGEWAAKVHTKVAALGVRVDHCKECVAHAGRVPRAPDAGAADALRRRAENAESALQRTLDTFALSGRQATTTSAQAEEACRRAELEYRHQQELYQQMVDARQVQDAAMHARIANLSYLAQKPAPGDADAPVSAASSPRRGQDAGRITAACFVNAAGGDPVASTLAALEGRVKEHLLRHDAMVAELFEYTSLKVDALQAEQRKVAPPPPLPYQPQVSTQPRATRPRTRSSASAQEPLPRVSGVREAVSTADVSSPSFVPATSLVRTASHQDPFSPLPAASHVVASPAPGAADDAGALAPASARTHHDASISAMLDSARFPSGPPRSGPPLSRAHRTLSALDNELLLERSELSLLARETYLDARAGAPSKKSVELYSECQRLLEESRSQKQPNRVPKECTAFKQAWGKPVCANCGEQKSRCPAYAAPTLKTRMIAPVRAPFCR